ncbi:H-NS family histone-like protein [Aliidiomarina celeris]|uniref:H-NS family histone-like protein n=1 Tax=Aliidiomarina celeris TaxID=2249428 RepID=UPI000DE9A980|nr:H-NS family nucleoid-associated regulatory protein [Aliidiomarina celeris]
MKNFTDILTHARRLNAATKSLSVAELKEVAIKLDGVISQREQDEAELAQQQAAKRAEAERLRREIDAAGLDLADIFGDVAPVGNPKVKRKRAPKPPKYEYTDENGELKTWTGQGRTPKPIQDAINAGGNKNDFLIK